MAKNTASATQEHLPIAGIQDGVIIMNDGSVRAVIKVEPINFELKSEVEQNGIIYAYQAFLNSLDFPIQIIVQSKKLDLERYLAKLEETVKNMTSDLLRIQTEDYIGFVRRLISVANIMSKRFYIVVSYAASAKENPVGGFTKMFHHTPTGPLMNQDQFERYRSEVFNRANGIGGGIGRIGMRVSLLSTQELIELFYGIYNPDIATEERLTNMSDINDSVVSSNIEPRQPTEADIPLDQTIPPSA
jgi:type IV secretory pathway VirB4 component